MVGSAVTVALPADNGRRLPSASAFSRLEKQTANEPLPRVITRYSTIAAMMNMSTLMPITKGLLDKSKKEEFAVVSASLVSSAVGVDVGTYTLGLVVGTAVGNAVGEVEWPLAVDGDTDGARVGGLVGESDWSMVSVGMTVGEYDGV